MPMFDDPVFDDARPNWLIPPYEGFVSEDLDRLTGLPSHTQLIDGSLVFAAPQDGYHSVSLDILGGELDRQAPLEFRTIRQTTITLSRTQRLEPDLMVVHAAAFRDLGQTDFDRDDVVVAIEVVQPSSLDRDRIRKPQLYAEAGIEHFWRVEHINDRTTVYSHTLDPRSRLYAINGIHRDRLELGVPFPVSIDLTEIDRYWER
jgi:Uma2 family endonuclease